MLFEQYERLLRTVQDAWTSQYDVDAFRKVLRSYQVALINPADKRRNAKDEEMVKSKKISGVQDVPVLQLEERQVNYILQVSKALNLAELECVRLFWIASERAARDPSARMNLRDAIQKIVYDLHFTRRHNLLIALFDLVLMYQSDQFPDDMVTIINEFVNELVRNGLVNNLAALITDLLQLTRKPTIPEVKKQQDIELWNAVQILFALFRKHEPSTAEAVRLYDLLWTCSELQAANPTDQTLTFITWTLLCTLITALETKFGSIEMASRLSKVQDDIKEFAHFPPEFGGAAPADEKADAKDEKNAFSLTPNAGGSADGKTTTLKKWTNPTFYVGFLMAYLLFLKRLKPLHTYLHLSDAKIQELLSAHANINFYSTMDVQFLQSKRFQQEPRAPMIGEAMAEFFDAMITYNFEELKALRRQERDQSFKHDSKEARHNFSAFLSIVAKVCRVSPSCVRMFWDNRAFSDFLVNDLNDTDGPAVSLDSPLLPAYVELFESLCRDAADGGPDHVYTLLKESQKLNWEIIFGGFRQVLIQQSAPTQPQAVEQYDQYGRVYRTTKVPAKPPPLLSKRDETILKGMLRLVKAVVKSPTIQNILFKTGEFKVMDVLFGLLACRFNSSLKAHILQTVTAFARYNAEIGAHVWERLEQSQILPTFAIAQPASNSSLGAANSSSVGMHKEQDFKHGGSFGLMNGAGAQQQNLTGLLGTGNAAGVEAAGNSDSNKLRGLYYDLQEVEQKDKTYPLTTAFIELIRVLLYATPIPNLLGGGYRVPGIAPYIEFVQQQVFVQLDDRQYNDPRDLWSMTEISLAIFCKLLEEFDVEREQFLERDVLIKGQRLPVEQSAGFELMREMLTGGKFFLKLLHVLQRTYGVLVAEEQTEFIPAVASSLLFSLKMIAGALEREDAFSAKLKTQNPQARVELVTNQLLRRQNEIIVIAKAVELVIQPELHADDEALFDVLHNSSDIGFFASSIILHCSNVDGTLLLKMFENARESKNICLAFAEQLRNAQTPPEVDDASGAAPDSNELDISNRARITILEILLSNLPAAEPNLTHLLLGFNVTEHIETGDLNESNSRAVLDTLIDLARKPQFAKQYASLAESVYELFYKLCANHVTSKPFLTFLQHYDLFFFSLLESLPTKIPAVHSTCFLLQRSWVLKTIALELHLTCSRNASATGAGSADSFGGGWSDYINDALLKLGFLSPPEEKSLSVGVADLEQRRMKVLDLLEVIQVMIPENPPAIPADVSGVRTAACKVYDTPRSFQYNIKSLYLLCSRVLDEQQCAQLCANALKWNQLNTLLSACRDAFEGWKQTVEIVLYKCFDPEHDPDRYEVVLFELLGGALQKLISEDRVWLCLGEELSAVALTVMAKIREQVGITSGTRGSQSHHILEMLLESILQNRHHVTRSHLYGVFANYIQYTHELQAPHLSAASSAIGAGDTPYGSAGSRGTAGAGRGAAAPRDVREEQRHLEVRNAQLLEKQGAKLLHIVCTDAMDGQAQLRSMAFVFLTTLLAEDRNHIWLDGLRKKGYIGHFLKKLKEQDTLLRQAVSSQHLLHYEQILNYESLMSFLVKLSEDKEGTLLVLLEYDAIRVLSSCKFLEHRPTASHEFDSKSSSAAAAAASRSSSSSLALMALNNNGTAVATTSSSTSSSLQLPSSTQRYHQLLIPSLRLMVSCLASAPDNITLHRHTLEFTMVQDETIKSILLDNSKPVYLSTLHALKLTTAIYYYLYAGPLYTRDPAQDKRTDITRHEKLLIKLLARYAEPNQSARLRSLPGANFDSSSSGSGASSAGAGEFEFEGDTPEDLCDEIVRNVTAALVVKTLKDSSPPPAPVPIGASGPSAAAAAAAATALPTRARRVVLLGPRLVQEEKSEDGVVHSVVLLRVLDRMVKKAVRALADYDSAQAQLESISSSASAGGGGEAAFDATFGGTSGGSSTALVAVTSASETHKRNVSVQRVLTALDVHAQHIYLYFYIIENALQLLYHHVKIFFGNNGVTSTGAGSSASAAAAAAAAAVGDRKDSKSDANGAPAAPLLSITQLVQFHKDCSLTFRPLLEQLKELLRVCDSSNAVAETGLNGFLATGSGAGFGGSGSGSGRSRGSTFIRTLSKKLSQLLLKYLEE